MRNFIVFYFSLTIFSLIIKILSWAGHVARMGEGGSAFKILAGKIPTGMPRFTCEDNVTVDFEK